VVKVVFSHPKLRKQPFFWNFQNPRGPWPRPSDAHAQAVWTNRSHMWKTLCSWGKQEKILVLRPFVWEYAELVLHLKRSVCPPSDRTFICPSPKSCHTFAGWADPLIFALSNKQVTFSTQCWLGLRGTLTLWKRTCAITLDDLKWFIVKCFLEKR